MGQCRTVGDIRETFRHEQGIDLEWEIPEFFSLPDSSDCIFYSPDFSYGGACWYLIVYPNGQAYCASQGWIVLFLCRRLCSPQKAVRFGLGIRRADGAKEDMLWDLRLPEGCTHIRVNEFLLRSDLLKRRCELAPSNSLTVTCTMYQDEAPFFRDNIWTYSDEQKPTCVQFKFDEETDKNARTDNVVKNIDEQKPTRVQFKFSEQMDKNTRICENIAQKIQVREVPDNISRKKAESYVNEKGDSNMQRSIKQAMKCILKYFGNCMGRQLQN